MAGHGLFLGRRGDRQSDLLLSWDELPRSAGDPFYDRLQGVLRTADFDCFVEELYEPYSSSSTRGRSSLPDHSWLSKTRPGKKLSNEDWQSPADPDARIAKMMDGRTRLGYKPEHGVDLDSGAIAAAPIHTTDQGETKTLPTTLEVAKANLKTVGRAPIQNDPAELVERGFALNLDRGGMRRAWLRSQGNSSHTIQDNRPAPRRLSAAPALPPPHQGRRAAALRTTPAPMPCSISKLNSVNVSLN